LKESATGQAIYENIFNFITAKNNDNSTDLNKATYSTELVRKLLLLYTKENDLIYDSFMGTGTTANACIIEKRNYLGSELSEEQCKYAEKRIQLHLKQKTLF
jgi:site-specific DNA-methyltransferase (adenine-specific)